MTLAPPLRRLLTAVALVVAAVGVGVSAPAAAAAAGCSSAAGVTVVVDFNELGGGVPSVCDAAGGGKKAASLFAQNGFALTYASQTPGFVCRVSGVPESDPCQGTSPGNAYWGLWWSDGKSGSWSYSSLGAGSLTIPEGGYVAFSWDQSDGSAPPSFTPVAHKSEPTPTPTPSPTQSPTRTPSPTSGPTATPSTSHAAPPSGSASASAVPDGAAGTSAASPSPNATSATPSASATSGSPSPGAVPTDVPTEGASPDHYVRPEAAEPESDGLPPFVAPALIGTVFGVAGVVFLVRRRPGSP